MLAYFQDGDSDEAEILREAKCEGAPAFWWLRSPFNVGGESVYSVTAGFNTSGTHFNYFAINVNGAVRPAMVLDSNSAITEDSLLV